MPFLIRTQLAPFVSALAVLHSWSTLIVARKPGIGRRECLLFRMLLSRLIVNLMWNSVLSPFLRGSFESFKAAIQWGNFKPRTFAGSTHKWPKVVHKICPETSNTYYDVIFFEEAANSLGFDPKSFSRIFGTKMFQNFDFLIFFYIRFNFLILWTVLQFSKWK